MATTYTVSSGDYIRPLNKCILKEFPVHTSQTVLKGSVLQKAGGGYENRVILSTDSITSGIVGVAAEAITTTATHVAATDKVLVWVADEKTEFIGRTVADDAVDFTDIGVRVSLEIDGTNSITRVETDDVTNECVAVLRYLTPGTMNVQATEGDVSVWAVFKFLPGATIYNATVLA
ncbi:MAG: hypothetical protein NUW01_06680 [Gemmatimonadaceae bacterium]|nr:hypothetical protein [Gemmatimonadaceae bacterium]